MMYDFVPKHLPLPPAERNVSALPVVGHRMGTPQDASNMSPPQNTNSELLHNPPQQYGKWVTGGLPHDLKAQQGLEDNKQHFQSGLKLVTMTTSQPSPGFGVNKEKDGPSFRPRRTRKVIAASTAFNPRFSTPAQRLTYPSIARNRLGRSLHKSILRGKSGLL